MTELVLIARMLESPLTAIRWRNLPRVQGLCQLTLEPQRLMSPSQPITPMLQCNRQVTMAPDTATATSKCVMRLQRKRRHRPTQARATSIREPQKGLHGPNKMGHPGKTLPKESTKQPRITMGRLINSSGDRKKPLLTCQLQLVGHKRKVTRGNSCNWSSTNKSPNKKTMVMVGLDPPRMRNTK